MAWAFFIPFFLISAGLTTWAAFRLRTNRRKARQIEETKQSSIEKLREGYRRVKGTVVARGELLRSPLNNTRCVFFRFRVEEQRTRSNGRHSSTYWKTIVNDSESVPVAVEDETGKAEVDLAEAEVVLKSAERTSSSVFNSPPPKLERLMKDRYGKSTSGWFFNKTMRYTEEVLEEGATVNVAGDVEFRKKSEVPVFCKSENDLIVSDKSQGALVSHYQSKARWCLTGVITGSVVSFLCLIGGILLSNAIPDSGLGRQANRGPDRQQQPRNIRPQPENPKPQPENPKPQPRGLEDGSPAKVYLSDLEEFDVQVGYGRFGKKGQLGYGITFGENDRKITVGGVEDPNGLSMHAPDAGASRVRYRLNKKAKTFQARAGINDLVEGNYRLEAPLTFKILGDGKELGTSAPIGTPGTAEPCKADVAGVEVLELRVECPKGKTVARAVWLDAHVLRTP